MQPGVLARVPGCTQESMRQSDPHLYLSSPSPWCSTRMMERQVSRPMKSATQGMRGQPTGVPQLPRRGPAGWRAGAQPWLQGTAGQPAGTQRGHRAYGPGATPTPGSLKPQLLRHPLNPSAAAADWSRARRGRFASPPASVRGPMGWLVPSFMPVSMSCAVPTPCCTCSDGGGRTTRRHVEKCSHCLIGPRAHNAALCKTGQSRLQPSGAALPRGAAVGRQRAHLHEREEGLVDHGHQHAVHNEAGAVLRGGVGWGGVEEEGGGGRGGRNNAHVLGYICEWHKNRCIAMHRCSTEDRWATHALLRMAAPAAGRQVGGAGAA